MPFTIACPMCGAAMRVAESVAGKCVNCPKCKSLVTVPAPQAQISERGQLESRTAEKLNQQEWQQVNQDVIDPGTHSLSGSSKQLRRKLTIIQFQKRLRGLCGKFLGDSVGERIVCALIIAVIPFALSFGLSIAVRQPAVYAIFQGLGAFVIVAVTGCLLVTRGGNDDSLEAKRTQLIKLIPTVEAAEQQAQIAQHERQQAVAARAYRQEMRPRPQRQERELPALREMDYDGPRVVHVHHHHHRSGGVAAVLELVFGLFLGTFGIGHIYAGNVGLGICVMLGWWFFVFVNVVLIFLSCGVWYLIAIFLVPACWFVMIVCSPIMAASSVQ